MEGYSRARRRQAVRKVSKYLRELIRVRLSKAQSKYNMFQKQSYAAW